MYILRIVSQHMVWLTILLNAVLAVNSLQFKFFSAKYTILELFCTLFPLVLLLLCCSLLAWPCVVSSCRRSWSSLSLLLSPRLRRRRRFMVVECTLLNVLGKSLLFNVSLWFPAASAQTTVRLQDDDD